MSSQLQCMDGFLGSKKQWVFHSLDSGSYLDSKRLCLSSTIEALTDLWGPSWIIASDSSQNEVKQYDIRSGAIIPWSTLDDTSDNQSRPHDAEIFRRWIPFKKWKEVEVLRHQVTPPRKHILSSAILLIGARHKYGLLINENCIPSPDHLLRMKSRLSVREALRRPNTSRARRLVDSQATQIQGSAMGIVSGSVQLTYKRRHTMKFALVERWRHGLRNPIDLEAYCGVEISLCSRNARRRRLLIILASDTMVNHLHAISFTWGAGVSNMHI